VITNDFLGNNNRDYTPPTLGECEEAIGIPASQWVSRCYEIVCKIYEELNVVGCTQYGFYYGPIHDNSRFAGRLLARHGWIKLNDGRIYDPTRWTFDSPDYPYVFCAEDHRDEYDMGMNRIRSMLRGDAPEPENGEKLYTLDLGKVTSEWCALLFPSLPDNRHNEQLVLSQKQLIWLANCDPNVLGLTAKIIYDAMKDIRLIGLVPIDNRMAVGMK
jgi:hypothetical protein